MPTQGDGEAIPLMLYFRARISFVYRGSKVLANFLPKVKKRVLMYF